MKNDHIREKHLRIKLARLHREYQERAKPIIDALVEIEARKAPVPLRPYKPQEILCRECPRCHRIIPHDQPCPDCAK